MRRLKPYPAYKDSGVEWLGEIPARWEVLAVRRLIGRIEQGWSPVAEDRLAGPDEWAVIKLSAVSKGRFVGDEHKALPADLAPDRRYEIREGDFLLTRANTPELVGDVCVARGVRRGLMLCDLVYRLRLGSEQIAPSYLAYWFLSRAGRYQIEVDARGSSQSMVKVSQGHIRAWTVVLPPADEQRTIAAFLDRETASIDALVAKKERLIELLQEKRTALITRAVTKGLDPSVSMKDSGVEWLGEIPAHWNVERIKWAARMESGHTPDKKVDSYWLGGDIPWVSLADTGQLREVDYITDTTVKTTSDGIAHSSAHILPAGTVLFSRDATIGLCAITRAGMAVSQHFIGWVCSARITPEYLLFVLRSMAQELERLTMGATVRTIGMPDVRSLATPIPPVMEQERIVVHVHQNRSQIDALISKVREAIDHLKELRTALISAAVTGKIDVREEVANEGPADPSGRRHAVGS